MKLIYAISRFSLAAIFFYHGLVPKLIYKNGHEVRMNNTLLPFVEENIALYATGIAEIVFAVLIIAFYKTRELNYICIAFACIATTVLAVWLPDLFQYAFNPFSTNLAVIALATINLPALKRE